MSDIDQHIRDAFRADDDALAAFLDDEPSLFDQVAQTFRGSNRALVFLSVGIGIVFMATSVTCAIQFFLADTTKAMIAWALGLVFSLMAIAIMKVWYWMELSKNALAREIKRLELEIAALATRMRSDR
jgi:uncharacterized membrane protein YciS (DUF1049 family)